MTYFIESSKTRAVFFQKISFLILVYLISGLLVSCTNYTRNQEQLDTCTSRGGQIKQVCVRMDASKQCVEWADKCVGSTMSLKAYKYQQAEKERRYQQGKSIQRKLDALPPSKPKEQTYEQRQKLQAYYQQRQDEKWKGILEEYRAQSISKKTKKLLRENQNIVWLHGVWCSGDPLQAKHIYEIVFDQQVERLTPPREHGSMPVSLRLFVVDAGNNYFDIWVFGARWFGELKGFHTGTRIKRLSNDQYEIVQSLKYKHGEKPPSTFRDEVTKHSLQVKTQPDSEIKKIYTKCE